MYQMEWNMSVIKGLLEKRGIALSNSRVSGPRSRLLQQADVMLSKLSKFKSMSELDNEAVTQNWWSPKPNQDERRIVMRYAGMTVDDTSAYVPNTLEAITNIITEYKAAIMETSDADWAAEEAKRKKK
jgi:hypothetical protein